jgi:hypothetical protein
MQVFAQNYKEDTITFTLTAQGQSSVSTSTAVNAGNWSQLPTHYKTTTKKLTQTDVLEAIAIILHDNAKWYSSKASLVLVQGELSGFLAMDPDLAHAYAEHDNDDILDGNYGDEWPMYDVSTDLPNATDTMFAQLPNGRHFQAVPESQFDLTDDEFDIDTPADFIGKFPTGHQQPWGQIFVKDPSARTVDGYSYDAITPWCENVTFFFAITVQECYDCYYLNSFISDSTFNFKGTASPVPCCGSTQVMLGKGVDNYYMTMSFDNTVNNPYLNYDMWDYIDYYFETESWYTGWIGLEPGYETVYPWIIEYEGVYPDALPYFDPIKSGALPDQEVYLMRFTLNGIMTYTWTLEFINSADLWPDFVGTGSYAVNGYGYIALVCDLLTGNVKFTEKIVKTACCLDNYYWYDYWYGPGYYPIKHVDQEDSEYYPDSEWSDLWMDGVGYKNPYYNVDDITPFNTEASLSYHANFDESYEPWTTKVPIDWIRYYLHGDTWY